MQVSTNRTGVVADHAFFFFVIVKFYLRNPHDHGLVVGMVPVGLSLSGSVEPVIATVVGAAVVVVAAVVTVGGSAGVGSGRGVGGSASVVVTTSVSGAALAADVTGGVVGASVTVCVRLDNACRRGHRLRRHRRARLV